MHTIKLDRTFGCGVSQLTVIKTYDAE